MELVFESSNKMDFLDELEGLINYNHPLVQAKIKEIKDVTPSKTKQAKLAFEYVRDGIQHSFDTNSPVITISASETIDKQEGICFAKSHLLAALLRGMGIPAGFCYQRVLRKGALDSGYALHGLNAVYLDDIDRWFRIDPRGNKEGIQSEFDVNKEKLAYPIREEMGEVDYPHVFIHPLETVVDSMHMSKDCHELFYLRPEAL